MTTTNKNFFYVLLFFAMFGWGASWVNVKILSNYINDAYSKIQGNHTENTDCNMKINLSGFSFLAD